MRSRDSFSGQFGDFSRVASAQFELPGSEIAITSAITAT
jgi:hypothetical protein